MLKIVQIETKTYRLLVLQSFNYLAKEQAVEKVLQNGCNFQRFQFISQGKPEHSTLV